MKKERIVVGMLSAMFVFCSCGTTKKLADVSNPVEIMEHKGTAWGVSQPEWVGIVLTTPNQRTLSKALGLSEKKIWVLTKSGQNLDGLQTWVDQVDARAEIASSIQQTVKDTVTAQLKGEVDSDSDIEKEVTRYSERITNISAVGLAKETDWWTKTRQLKVGVKKAESDADYQIQYNYMVIYSMEEKLFHNQLIKAFEGLDTTEKAKQITNAVVDAVVDKADLKL